MHSWTVPRLRHHVTFGEALIAQLTQISNSSTTKVLSKITSVPSPQGQTPRVSNAVGCCGTVVHSPVDNSIAPVTRLLRARMHTALGQLSQLAVQIDSLVGILTESLTVVGLVINLMLLKYSNFFLLERLLLNDREQKSITG